eukprot:3487776-Prymnesium_polylepis.1
MRVAPELSTVYWLPLTCTVTFWPCAQCVPTEHESPSTPLPTATSVCAPVKSQASYALCDAIFSRLCQLDDQWKYTWPLMPQYTGLG